MRILGQTLLLGTAAALAFFATPACVDNDQSIFIRDVLAPPTTRTNNECTYTNDPTQAALFQGTLDVAVRDSYTAVMLVGNQMIQRGDNTAPRSESNKAHINGAVVRVTDANGGAIASFTSPSQGFVDQAEGTQATYGTFAVIAIDAPTAAKIRKGMPAGGQQLVLANIKAFGETLGGVDLESGEYQLPIKVCNGCLIDFGGFDDTATPGVDCNLGIATLASGTQSGSTTLPCNPGQDEITPCYLCTGRTVTCEGNEPGAPPPLPHSCAGETDYHPCQTGPADF